MNESPQIKCKKCKKKMIRIISGGCYISQGIKPRLEDQKESEHKKIVKDPERAHRKRKRQFGDDAGSMVEKSDPRHVIKRGRTLGWQEKTVDKHEFIKAASKDSFMVQQAINALKGKS